MDTQTLRTFLTLSTLKSFTQTAELLFVAQSTVTNRIADLERELGKKLFIRDKKNINLTKEGELFLTYAKRIVELEEQSLKEIHSFCYHKNLRIGTTNTIYECHLYPVVHDIITKNLNTCVKVIIGHTNDLLHMLGDGVIDVAFSYLPFTKSGFICNPYYSDDLILVTARKDEAYVKGIRRDQLCELNYLMCDFALQEVGIFIRGLFPEYYQFSFEIDNSTKLLHYLRDGLGYSFLPYSIVKEDLNNHTLISIPLLDFETPKIKSYCIYREDNELSDTLYKKGGFSHERC